MTVLNKAQQLINDLDDYGFKLVKKEAVGLIFKAELYGGYVIVWFRKGLQLKNMNQAILEREVWYWFLKLAEMETA